MRRKEQAPERRHVTIDRDDIRAIEEGSYAAMRGMETDLTVRLQCLALRFRTESQFYAHEENDAGNVVPLR